MKNILLTIAIGAPVALADYVKTTLYTTEGSPDCGDDENVDHVEYVIWSCRNYDDGTRYAFLIVRTRVAALTIDFKICTTLVVEDA